jgi:hypothetical protein
VRDEQSGGDVGARIHYGIEGLAGVSGESRPLRQRLGAEPFVKHEVDISAGKEIRHWLFLDVESSHGTLCVLPSS